MPGQINRGSFLGEQIFKYSLDPKYKNYVEIGTWNGQGSTKCFMDGILSRTDDSCLYTLEANIEFYSEASSYWNPFIMTYRIPYPKLKMLYGRIIEKEELVPIDEVKNHKIFNEHPWLEWRDRNIQEYDACDNILSNLPDKIDVLLLDGGQFSTQAEWGKLKERTQIILLDDTKTFKTEKIRDEIIKEKDTWEIIFDDTEMRHGTFIASRKNI
jgi:hypothetical protein